MSTDNSNEGQPGLVSNSDDDVEGHKLNMAGDDDQDVEGHVASYPSNAGETGEAEPGFAARLDGDDDVEGHSLRN